MYEWPWYILCCWLAADFLSGVFHWLEDRYFRVEWPVIGKLIAEPNERHHKAPLVFLYGSYWDRNWTTIIPAAVAGLVVFYLFGPTKWLLVFVFVSQANELHCFSHRRTKGIVRALQDCGVFCSSRQHGEHHKEPFDKRYCVMSNFLNPWLDTFGFWRGLEWMLAQCGIVPK